MRIETPATMIGRVALLAGLSLVAACGSSPIREELDPRTGITWTAEREPVAFARTETRYSRSARDYVFIGPVEVNRRGTREYFVWAGIGTTLDRGYLAPETSMPNRLYLEARGEPFELELLPWSERVPELDDVSAYAPHVGLEVELAARVTLDQLRLLSEEQPDSIRVGMADGSTVEYFRWRDGSGWAAFVAQSEGPP